MDQQQLIAVAGDFAIAILLGALVGIEREKRKAEEQEPGHIAGLRTFTLLALLGAAAGFLSKNLSSPWILAAALLVVGAFIVAGYFVTARSSDGGKGLTTEIAAIVVFLLGAMVMFGARELAIALGVVTAPVLAYKQPLHGFVEKLGWDDVYAGVRLLIATFIALPLYPTSPIDPWGALNPYKLWLLVILISSLSLVGYVLTRWLGPARGTALTGLTGGLVSSTAVTLSFAREARDNPQSAASLACGILLAWAVMFLRVIVLVAVVNRNAPGCRYSSRLLSMAVASGGYAAVLYFRDGSVDGRRLKAKWSREPVQPDRGGEVRGALRRGAACGQDRAGAFSAERALRGRRTRRADRCRCHHAVDVGIRARRRGESRGDRHRDRVAHQHDREMRDGLRARWGAAWQEAVGRHERDSERRVLPRRCCSKEVAGPRASATATAPTSAAMVIGTTHSA